MEPLYFTLRNKQSRGMAILQEGEPYVSISFELCELFRPSFETIQKATGKLIDPYDWIEFSGEDLNIVKEELVKVKREIEAAVLPFKVDMGQQKNFDGTTTKLISELQPTSVALVLRDILKLIDTAMKERKVLVCKGR